MLTYEIVKCRSFTHSHGINNQLGQGVLVIGATSNFMVNSVSDIDWGTGFEVEDIACGAVHTCALSINGSVRCCGWGMFLSVHTF